MSELTQRGISALKAGDRSVARKLLAGAVQEDETDVTAWLWLAGALDKDEERIMCLKQVLRLDPNNAPALRGLAQLEERIAQHAQAKAGSPAAQMDPARNPPSAANPPARAGRTRLGAFMDEAGAEMPSSLDEFRQAYEPSGDAIQLPPGEWNATSAVEEVAPPSGHRVDAQEEQPSQDASLHPQDVSLHPQDVSLHPQDVSLHPQDVSLHPQDVSLHSPDWSDLAGESPAALQETVEADGQPSSSQKEPESGQAEPVLPNETSELAGRDSHVPAASHLPAAEDRSGGGIGRIDPALPEGAAPQPAVSAAAVETGPAVSAPAQPVRRKSHAVDTGEGPMVIFRTRPSLVPPLICFWLFLFGAAGVGALLSGGAPLSLPLSITDLGPYTGLLLALGLGLLLELVVIYVMIRNFAARYELTSRTLTVRFRGKRARIAVMDVYGAECRQSGFQRVFGIGTLDLDVSVKGELAQVSLRDIPHCKRRLEQIREVIGE